MSRKRKGKKLGASGAMDMDETLHSALRYHQRGRLDKAERMYRKILRHYPDQPDALHFLGLIAGQLGKVDEAELLMRKAIEVLPQNAIYHHNFGTLMKGQGRWKEAIRCYQKAVEIDPNYVDAHYNMGDALLNYGNLRHAISCFQKALELKPDFAEAYTNMGNAFQDLGELEEAIACYKKTLQLEPYYPEAYCQLFFLLKETCSWEEIEGIERELDAFVASSSDLKTVDFESPFVSVATYAQPDRNYAVARLWSANIAKEVSRFGPRFSFDDRRLSKRRITVAYLSSDFHDHATAHLMLSLFGLHNRNEFEILCYSYGQDDGSGYRKRIQHDCDRFIDVANKGYCEVAEHIHETMVDILVDLKGYTTGGRMQIAALRPAPIQVSYLGFPGTTGADFIDYIIADRIVIPEDQAPYYSEKFVYLPHCYQVNDHAQVIAEKKWTKSYFGLPEDGMVFCSFNQGYKIDPTMFNVWMKILVGVPDSVLWLFVKSKTAEKNLKQGAEARGVNPERFFFAERLPKQDHLARLALADLALDTRIYNGHTTSSDSLWTGVPVIALQGSHFASRVSSSILRAIGLPELITKSLGEYESLAIRLAHKPDELQAIQEKIARNRSKAPLFDTARFVKYLEKAYKEMWEIFVAGEEPRHIAVAET
jgi:protein O-GlcNAc transferase